MTPPANRRRSPRNPGGSNRGRGGGARESAVDAAPDGWPDVVSAPGVGVPGERKSVRE
jgi:hypothetical protein